MPAQLPNILTGLRILLVPVFVMALLDERLAVAAVLFAFASITDWFDGRLARRMHAESNFGALMDPIADKALVASALLALVSLDVLAGWVAAVVIARELAVTLVRMAVTRRGLVLAAEQLGKLKTCVQGVTIMALICVPSSPGWVDALVLATVGLTLASAVEFAVGFRRRWRERGQVAPASASAAPLH